MSVVLLTPEQVARQLQVKERTVSSWLKTGRMRGIKIGRLWRIPEDSLTRFLARHESRPERTASGDDINIADWERFVAEQWADELADERQDIYSLDDGEPIRG
jgi:excisionase family DNA binding protein